MGGGLALLRTGDRVRIDLRKGTADILISDDEMAGAAPSSSAGRLSLSRNQTPWQEIQRGMVGQLGDGMVLEPAVKYQRIAQTKGCRGTTISRQRASPIRERVFLAVRSDARARDRPLDGRNRVRRMIC